MASETAMTVDEQIQSRMGETGKLAAALAKSQAAFPPIKKSRTARIQSQKGSYSYRYADLSDVLTAVTPILAKHELAVSQRYDFADGAILLVTVLLHSSGEQIASVLPVPHAEGRPQELGSAMTYMRRYAVTALLGIAAEEDDDASGAEAGGARVPDREKQRDVPSLKPVTAQGLPVGGKVSGDKLCTEKQRRMIWAKTMAKADALGIDQGAAEEGLRKILSDLDIASTKEIPFRAVDAIVHALDGWTLETFTGAPPEGMETGDGAPF